MGTRLRGDRPASLELPLKPGQASFNPRAMKLFEQEDPETRKRTPRTSKLLRRMKHKRERRAAKADEYHVPTYNRHCGWVR